MSRFTAEQVETWAGGRWLTRPPGVCHGVSHDSRTLGRGALFFAIGGDRFDGHAFVEAAFRGGAWGAVVSTAYAATAGAAATGPLLAVPEPGAALSRMAAAYRTCLTACVVGVTGSLGKTTVKEMVADVLAALGPTARSPSSWNNAIGVPLSLLSAAEGDIHAVFEVGMNHAGELAPLCAMIRPDWAVLTRVGPVHMEFFPSEEAIAREKAELIRALPPEGTAVLACDEPWYDLLARAAPGPVITVGWAGAGDYRAIALEEGGMEVSEPDGRRYRYTVSVPGEAALRNALRAVAVGRARGVPPECVAEALARFRPLPMRGEESLHAGVRWVNDAYNANPLSVKMALDVFAARSGMRRWVVLGSMHELANPVEEHRAIGQKAGEGPWAGLILVGRWAEEMAGAARSVGFPDGRLHCCPDVATAADLLRRAMQPGDAVLLKGSRAERIERVQQLCTAEKPDKESN